MGGISYPILTLIKTHNILEIVEISLGSLKIHSKYPWSSHALKVTIFKYHARWTGNICLNKNLISWTYFFNSLNWTNLLDWKLLSKEKNFQIYLTTFWSSNEGQYYWKIPLLWPLWPSLLPLLFMAVYKHPCCNLGKLFMAIVIDVQQLTSSILNSVSDWF